jgi:hypothetical protein
MMKRVDFENAAKVPYQGNYISRREQDVHPKPMKSQWNDSLLRGYP